MMGRGISIKLLLGFIILTASVSLKAAEYFVTTVSEFNRLPDFIPGDVIVLKNGVWEGFLEFEGIGTESQPITLRAETPGEVYFTGKSSMEIGGEYLVVDGLVYSNGALPSGHIVRFQSSDSKQAYHCRLTNTKFINYNPASKTTEYKWVSLHGQYNRVDHCHFEGKNHAGATMVVWLDDDGTPNYHQIDSNYFGSRPDLGVNGGETIRIGTSDNSMNDSYTTVEYNVFEECDGEIEIISNKSCKNVYRHNTFRNSEGTLTLRHGNACEVYGNFFFGTSEKNCGGIRIIGEDHRVYNNYLQDIPGSGFRAAICLTNGVPDSPLNRYFQVINAHVVNNTIVDCKNPIVIGAGVSTELSLPPKDCFISNNMVAIYSSSTSRIIDYDDEPENMTYQNNIMYGATLGIPSQSGILEEDPELEFSDFWRPTAFSNVVDYGVDTFSYVLDDVDGHLRGTSNDAGCDQVSTDPISNVPLKKSDVGPNWIKSQKLVSVDDGGKALESYISSANNGDIIILTTSGGIYQVDTSATLSAQITIRAEYGLEERPVIAAKGNVDEFILFDESANLNISGINITGGGTNTDSFKNLFATASALDHNDTLKLIVNDCQIKDILNSNGGNLLSVMVPVVFKQLSLNNVQVYDVVGQAFAFGNSSYALDTKITNCSFINIGKEALLMSVPTQGDALALINHCTFDSIGFLDSGYEVITLSGVDVNIKNSLITNANSLTSTLTITGANSLLDFCLLWNTANVNANNGAIVGTSIIKDQNVYYTDRSRYFFSLLSASPALDYADDGENLGDLYWNDHGVLGDNAFLTDLQLDNETVNGFSYDIFEYAEIVSDPLSYSVTVIKQDTLASVVIDYPETIPGECIITVTAENNFTTEVYTIDLSKIETSIEGMNVAKNGLVMYPNPCKDVLIIESQEVGLAKIYDPTGRLVKELLLDDSKSSHNISDLQSGYYKVIYMSKNISLSTSLIVE